MLMYVQAITQLGEYTASFAVSQRRIWCLLRHDVLTSSLHFNFLIKLINNLIMFTGRDPRPASQSEQEKKNDAVIAHVIYAAFYPLKPLPTTPTRGLFVTMTPPSPPAFIPYQRQTFRAPLRRRQERLQASTTRTYRPPFKSAMIPFVRHQQPLASFLVVYGTGR